MLFDINNLLDSVIIVFVVIDNFLCIVYVNYVGQVFFVIGIKQLYGYSIVDFFVFNIINKVCLCVVFCSGQDFIENEVKLYFWDNCVVLVDLIVMNLNIDDGFWLLFEVKKIDQ